MDPKPPPTPGTARQGGRHPARRRHPAARSRVVAGALSAVLFLGLGAGMAANQADTTTTATADSTTTGSSEDGRSSSSGWAATPGSSSDQSAMTGSQGS
jgi:hypothetical protein